MVVVCVCECVCVCVVAVVCVCERVTVCVVAVVCVGMFCRRPPEEAIESSDARVVAITRRVVNIYID